MQRQQVNPWMWQDKFGFSHAWRVDGARSVIFVSGQGPTSPSGEVVGDDFESQARKAMENLQTVLEAAGASMDAVVKLTVYLTDIANLRGFGRVRSQFFAGKQPASTALEVRALAFPDRTIEVEAIAAL